MMRDDSELEGAYRLFGNPNVSADAILDAHFAATGERVRSSKARTLVVHDTTECSFGGSGERDGLGRVSNGGKGLSIHVALALAPDGAPHGLLDVVTHTRLAPAEPRRTRQKRLPGQRESARWAKSVERAISRVGDASDVVHVMDREADSYLLYDDLVRARQAFVIRISHDRRILDDEHGYLHEAIEDVEATLEREVRLSRRTDRNRHISAKTTYPARQGRQARLAVGARATTILCGKRHRRFTKRAELALNVVRVWELDPPSGQPAVEWLLITNLPTDSAAQLEAVVDAYRARWTIEEYFKALKSGCAFEQRQLASRHALEKALAILAPIACRLLLLRTLARTRQRAPATDVLTSVQVDVLRAISRRFKLPRNPSVRHALVAVAGLGGFLRRNGEPGWQTIGLGFEQLLQAEIIWKAAKHGHRSDQS